MSQPYTALDVLLETRRRFKRADIDDDLLDAYLDDIEDIPPPALALICKQLRRSLDFFPSVAQIRNAYVDAVLPDELGKSYAWVLHRMFHGEYSQYSGRSAEPTEYPDLLTESTVQEIGWPALYMLDDFNRDRAYRETYKRLRTERIAAANRGTMFDLGVAMLGEGADMQIVRIEYPEPVAALDAGSVVSVPLPRLVSENDPHIETLPPKCFYCAETLGKPHKPGCTIAHRTALEVVK